MIFISKKHDFYQFVPQTPDLSPAKSSNLIDTHLDVSLRERSDRRVSPARINGIEMLLPEDREKHDKHPDVIKSS